MFGKDLHFHTGTLNYYYTPQPPPLRLLPPPLPKLLTAGTHAIFLLSDILKSCVVAVNRPPLYDNGGKKDATSAEKRQKPILISVWMRANVK